MSVDKCLLEKIITEHVRASYIDKSKVRGVEPDQSMWKSEWEGGKQIETLEKSTGNGHLNSNLVLPLQALVSLKLHRALTRLFLHLSPVVLHNSVLRNHTQPTDTDSPAAKI